MFKNVKIVNIFWNITRYDIPNEYAETPKIKAYFISESKSGIITIIYKNKKPTVSYELPFISKIIYFKIYYLKFVNKIFITNKDIDINSLPEEKIKLAIEEGKIQLNKELAIQFKNSLIL